MNDRQDQIGLNIFEQINLICKEFRKAWKEGQRPRIEDWLPRVKENARSNLFSNLIQLEIRIRENLNERPDSTEYLKRFSEFASLVRQAFDESTMAALDGALVSTPGYGAGDDRTRTFQIPAANRLGDYELLSELGRGGFGVVYKARHLTRNNVVALKTLPTGVDGQELNADRLHKFRHEFRSLSEINHPNLVGMQTLEVDGAQWFFTMDLIEGEDFLTFVRPGEQLDIGRLRSAIKQLAKGIIGLHELRIIHRDLKPSNVLVDQNGQVMILDFGLVAELQKTADLTVSKSAMFAGTPRYAAPEQMFGERSEASDWYALGVMLYEALSGTPPFTGHQMELLQKKQNEDPPRLIDRDNLPDENLDLARLADGLLKRDPKLRPDSEEIVQALGLDIESTTHGSFDADDTEGNKSMPPDQILIGRESQLAELAEAKRRLQEQRDPVVVLISGLSGEGKSTLAETFLHPIRLGTEMLVLSGRCYDRESVPFKVVDSQIDPLVNFLRSRSREEVLEMLPSDISFLARLFPTLKRVSAIADYPSRLAAGIDEKQTRYRAFAALRDLLRAITVTTPVVMFIDDLQWGDADSAEVVANLLAPPQPPAVMLLGTYRSDEKVDSPFLKEWDDILQKASLQIDQRQIEVKPLTESEFRLFVRSKMGDHVEPPEALFTDTQGNPYFLEQMLEGFDPDTGEFQAIPLKDMIDGKLAKLPDQAAALLKCIAVSGKSLSLEEASMVAGEATPAVGTLTHMRSERLVRWINSQDQQLVDTYHDKIREAVIGRLDDLERCGIHRAFGELIERLGGGGQGVVLSRSTTAEQSDPATIPVEHQPRVYDLAYHFSEAGDPRAFRYLMEAGDASMQAYASEDAIDYLTKAVERAPLDADRPTLYRLWEQLGEAFHRAQKFPDAVQAYETAVKFADEDLQRADCDNGIGHAQVCMGEIDDAICTFDQALIRLGIRRSKVLPIVLLQTSYSSLLCFAGRWSRPTLRTDDSRARAGAAFLAWYGIGNALVAHDLIGYTHACGRYWIAAAGSGDENKIMYAYAKQSLNYSLFSFMWIAKLMAQRAAKHAERVVGQVARAEIDIVRGHYQYFSGRLNEAEIPLREGCQVLDQTGHTWFRGMGYHCLRHVCHLQGDAQKELDAARRELAIAEANSDINLRCWANYGIANALARNGKLSQAWDHMRVAIDLMVGKGRSSISEQITLHTKGYLQMQSSDYQGARESLELARQYLFKSFTFVEYTIRTYPLLIQSLVGPDWMTPRQDPDVRRAKKLCRLARFLAWRFPNYRPHTLRVRARTSAALGHPRRAKRLLNRSVNVARQMGTEYDLARSLLDLAAIDESRREKLRSEGQRLLKQLHAVVPYAERGLLGEDPDMSLVAPSPAEFNAQQEANN